MDLADIPSSREPLDTHSASRDCWPGGTLEFWQRTGRSPRPSQVFWPESEEQVLRVLQAASAQTIPVVPYGMGSGVCGGARGREGSWVLDTKRLNRIEPVDEEAWTIRVGAGVNGQELEDRLAARGFTLGHSPSSISCSSVGGWAAARSAGQFSSRYGVFEDMVLGLTAVTPGRGILRIGLHGDDDPALLPLLLGSEGTLAVITEVTLRVWRSPEARWLRGYRFRTVDDALDAVRRLMQGELWPSVVRIYDPVDTRIGGRTKPKRSRDQAFFDGWLKAVADLPPVRRRTLALPLRLPGVLNALFEQLASGCLVIVGWEGRAATVEALSTAGQAILEERGEDLGSAPGQRWYDSRHAVSYKLMPVFERGGFADTMEIAARWSVLPGAYAAVREAVRDHAVVLAHMSHVYPEGGSIYFSFAGRGDRSTYEAVWRLAQQAALDAGASISHHHGIGSLKMRWASAEVGAAVEGWVQTRDALDPMGVLNPGRLFEASGVDPGPDPRLHETDGLVRVDLDGDLDDRTGRAALLGAELMFPWDQLPAPPRMLRDHWAIGWSEVSARVEARLARLGRGPRSAVGPDLRGWLATQSAGRARCTVPIVSQGPRWMGRAEVRDPWRVARMLVRSDLRPAVLTVEDGFLVVGFRGPAARALGALCRRWVPGMEEVPYRGVPLPADVEPTDLDDPRVCAVGSHHVVRRRR
jgi:alkyldihydroxyacetonephosphate synthase